MVTSNNTLGVTIVGRDQVSASIAKIETSVKRLDSTMTKLRGRFATGFINSATNRLMGVYTRGLYDLERALPDLISKGQQWAATVNSITDATGMSARQASLLAGEQTILGGSTDTLARSMIQLGKNAIGNKKLMDEMGVATQDANGHNLSAIEIFDNLRARIARTGPSLLGTAAAAKVFGKSIGDLQDLLQLTPKQIAILDERVQQSGLIVSENANKIAEAAARARGTLDASITGLGNELWQGLAPTFIKLIEGISNVINKNMAAIVQFVDKAVIFVAQLVGDLLGIDFNAAGFIDNLTAAGTQINNANDGLKQYQHNLNNTTTNSEKAATATSHHTISTKALTAALKELKAAQDASFFGGDMSNADRILAEQGQQMRIKNAKAAVAAARKSIAQQRAAGSGGSGTPKLPINYGTTRFHVPHLGGGGGGGGGGTYFDPYSGMNVPIGSLMGQPPAGVGSQSVAQQLVQAEKDASQSAKDVAASIKSAIGSLVLTVSHINTFLAPLGGFIGTLSRAFDLQSRIFEALLALPGQIADAILHPSLPGAPTTGSVAGTAVDILSQLGLIHPGSGGTQFTPHGAPIPVVVIPQGSGSGSGAGNAHHGPIDGAALAQALFGSGGGSKATDPLDPFNLWAGLGGPIGFKDTLTGIGTTVTGSAGSTLEDVNNSITSLPGQIATALGPSLGGFVTQTQLKTAISGVNSTITALGDNLRQRLTADESDISRVLAFKNAQPGIDSDQNTKIATLWQAVFPGPPPGFASGGGSRGHNHMKDIADMLRAGIKVRVVGAAHQGGTSSTSTHAFTRT